MQVCGDKERLGYYRKLEGFIAATIKPHLLAMQASEGGLPDHLQKVRPCPSPGFIYGLGNLIIELGTKLTSVRAHCRQFEDERPTGLCMAFVSLCRYLCIKAKCAIQYCLPRKLATFCVPFSARIETDKDNWIEPKSKKRDREEVNLVRRC